jgi:hypothetical protein
MHFFKTWTSRRARRPARKRLELLRLDERELPAVGFTATGAAAGTAPFVTVFRPDGSTLARFLAYDPAFTGGVNVAVGEFDGIFNTVEVVTGAGPSGGPHVKVFSVDTSTSVVTNLASFFAYDLTFMGGVSVAAGEIDGNQRLNEVVTGAGPGGGPHVKVFSFDTTPGAITTFASFMAYDPTFAGGVNVAVGRFGARLTGEIVTGAGAGGGPHVRVFDVGGDGTVTQAAGPLGSFMAFSPTFGGGVFVAAGNVNGSLLDGDELVVTAGPGGGPHVRVLDVNGFEFASFMAFDITYTGGVAPGTVGTLQLTVNSLVGGGVSLFTFASNGTFIRTIIVPIR